MEKKKIKYVYLSLALLYKTKLGFYYDTKPKNVLSV